MNFESWHDWSGAEVAGFVSKFCGLPEYHVALSRNLTGKSLKHLAGRGMLQKGLSRAGVGDADHQRRIAAAVGQLERLTAEELAAQLDVNLTQHASRNFKPTPPAVPRPKVPGGFRRPHVVNASQMAAGALTPRTKTVTEAGLRRSTDKAGLYSGARFTPWPFDKVDQPRGVSRAVLPTASREEGDLAPLQLRQRLAKTTFDYDDMRHADSPQPDVGFRGIQQLAAEEDGAATRIQAKFRQKQAAKEVQMKKEEKHAATQIQARYRGRKAAAEVQEIREQKSAATAIQARYRARVARQEVDAKRQERREMEEGAVKIQAVFRGRKTRQGGSTSAEGAQVETEKIFIDQDGNMLVDADGIPLDEDSAMAAIKIQAKYRQKQASAEVAAKRQEKQEMEEGALKIQAVFRGKQARKGLQGEGAAAETEAEEVFIDQDGNVLVDEDGIPLDAESAAAAIKIQAMYRKKQAAAEVAAMKQERKEMEEGAVKIQAVFRGRKARKGTQGGGEMASPWTRNQPQRHSRFNPCIGRSKQQQRWQRSAKRRKKWRREL
eukprot:TRINITY_DN52_c0_g1_i3.p1 TRINITY_DN52_c0_g1~~TRINITY_DN52_c0_g1_i3.p1  ORF type:complete len:575 (-),score=138.92 TRINITY_DN52_c0_g1_i3:196-1839(-)